MSVKALQAIGHALLERADRFEWRIHGIGMAQLYLPGDCRLHVWHKMFMVPNVSLMHTHAWSFKSWVLSGRVYQRRFWAIETQAPKGMTVSRLDYLHARITPGPDPQRHEYPNPVPLYRGEEETYAAGSSYEQSRDDIHLSLPTDGTVTLVERNRSRAKDDDYAYVFWPPGAEFVSAEPRPATTHEIRELQIKALSCWGREHG